MSDNFFATRLRVLITLLLLVAGFIVPVRASAQATDPLSVVQAWEAAVNAHDLDAAIALFADDAVWNDTHAAPGQPNPLKGKEAIRAFLAPIFKASPRDEASKFQVNGNTVTYFAKQWLDLNAVGFPPQLPLPIEANLTVTVQNGKITSFTVDNTPEWLEKVNAALAPLPQTGGEPFPAYLAFVALAGVVLLGAGIALVRRQAR